jgi:hypothetical protein
MFKDVLFALPGIALTVLCWGAYGSVLHRGQDHFKEVALGQGATELDLVALRLKPLICVGLAYFVVAIIVPTTLLIMRGNFGGGWGFGSVGWSLTAGTAGALGALGIILALSSGGKPIYVMPLVFGCAPIVNVFVSMWFNKIPFSSISPIFIAGMILVSVGAVTVLVFQPKAAAAKPKPPVVAPAGPASDAKAPPEDEESGESASASD